MKAALVLVCLVLGLGGLAVGAFLQFLILQKVGADSLMWFLFWFNIPVVIVLNILNEVLKRVRDDL